MRKISRAELLSLLPKQQIEIEKRLKQDYVDGMVVFEAGGRRTVCVYGRPYTLKNWQQAEGKSIAIDFVNHSAVAYYEKPSDEIELLAAE